MACAAAIAVPSVAGSLTSVFTSWRELCKENEKKRKKKARTRNQIILRPVRFVRSIEIKLEDLKYNNANQATGCTTLTNWYPDQVGLKLHQQCVVGHDTVRVQFVQVDPVRVLDVS